MISVVIPSLNEATNIARTIASAAPGAREIIVVDGGSSDDTVAIAEAAGAIVVRTEACRAHQMNEGAKAAGGDVLLFLHADTVLPDNYGSSVERASFSRKVAAGAFSLRIEGDDKKHRLVEAVVAIRCRLNSLPYGDQAIFVRATTFADSGGFADMQIMEDYEFIRRMKRRGKVIILPLRVTTSSRRWQKAGVVRTALVNFAIIVAYHFGVAPERLAGWYRNTRSAFTSPGDLNRPRV